MPKGLGNNEGAGHASETPSSHLLRCRLLAVVTAQSHTQKDGFVPDSITAVKIAEAVLVPVYGKEKIESEWPFKRRWRMASGLLMALCTARTARAA